VCVRVCVCVCVCVRACACERVLTCGEGALVPVVAGVGAARVYVRGGHLVLSLALPGLVLSPRIGDVVHHAGVKPTYAPPEGTVVRESLQGVCVCVCMYVCM
jgi:hypothetical protein